MTVQATAKRRRRQARNNYRHMAPMDRPHYARHDTATLTKREQRRRERERLIMSRKPKK